MVGDIVGRGVVGRGVVGRDVVGRGVGINVGTDETVGPGLTVGEEVGAQTLELPGAPPVK